MYKVVNISELKLASNFIESDKIIEISEDQSKMYIAENDYAHKSQTYLSSCINVVDTAMNSYLNAIDIVNTTYLTSNLNSIYMKNGSLIKQKTFDTIMNSDAFLTKEACKKIETNCISYLTELKNRAVSIVMAKLNESFVKQNSINRIVFGQKSAGDFEINNPSPQIAQWDPYDFNTGEFSLGSILYDTPLLHEIPAKSGTGTSIQGYDNVIEDFWNGNYGIYNDIDKSLKDGKEYMTFEEMKDSIGDNVYSFNRQVINSEQDFRISVPSASYDMKRNKTIPIAQLVEFFLKRQINCVIKRICDSYISKMYAVPDISVSLNGA